MKPHLCQCGQLVADATPPRPTPQGLEVLTPLQRQVVEGVLAGVPTDEIAGLLGKHPQTVRQVLRRARLALRRVGRRREASAWTSED